LNDCVLKDVIFSTKNPTIKKLDNICENVDNSVRAHCQVSILENLRINYPKIKFEYNENTTKEFVLTEEACMKNKTKQLLD
jgi:type VI protein secretion system component Hcp